MACKHQDQNDTASRCQVVSGLKPAGSPVGGYRLQNVCAESVPTIAYSYFRNRLRKSSLYKSFNVVPSKVQQCRTRLYESALRWQLAGKLATDTQHTSPKCRGSVRRAAFWLVGGMSYSIAVHVALSYSDGNPVLRFPALAVA